ncbi:MAG: PIG-L deacetylase family protein [bacterium]
MWFNFKSKLHLLTKHLLFPFFENLWVVCFTCVGFCSKRNKRVKNWTSPGNQRVLVISPHPDDETIGCGGIMQLHTNSGDRVAVLQVTDGGASEANGIARKQMRTIRRREGQAAAKHLKIAIQYFLALPEGYWQETELTAQLKDYLNQENPDILYAPSCVDYHPEHLKVARALAKALQNTHKNPVMRLYEIHVPLTPVLVNLKADISTVVANKIAALSAYKSQAVAMELIHRHHRYTRRLYRAKKGVEVFWEISAPQYIQILQKHDKLLQTWQFRRTYPRPFLDPLVYFTGLPQRQQLACELRCLNKDQNFCTVQSQNQLPATPNTFDLSK